MVYTVPVRVVRATYDAAAAAGEWEAHRVPLVEEIRTTKDSVAKRKADMKCAPWPFLLQISELSRRFVIPSPPPSWP